MSWINRKANFNYVFLETYTCGIVLTALEAKSFFEGGISFNDSYCLFKNDELYLKNFHISKPKFFKETIGDSWNPNGDRKLLLKKYELNRLKSKLLKGLTLVPTKAFVKDKRYIKLEIALAKGKKSWDKRETIKKRETEKNIKRELA